MKIDGEKTIFLDIDGTLLKHHGLTGQQSKLEPILLPGVKDKLNEWEENGYKIILITGRKESERKLTKKQLSDVGIRYDMLIMGVSRGDRVLINDMKLDSIEPTAVGINVKRNEGLKNINI